ncbi:MAG: DUF456 domain-containing protein [Candidatus Aminicenantes bacterium]|nr:DUF456 domain-containing protein [Candidatus Aminicenantes bacterium]
MILLVILACFFIILGLMGCVIPGLLGPPFSFLALILLSIAKKWEPFSPTFLIIMAVVTVLVTSVDYVFPAIGAKKYGSSKAGLWGAVLGMILGILFFPPFGMIMGAFLGAVLGEIISGKPSQEALKAGWGVFFGIMMAILFKLIASGIMTFYFVKALL